MDKERQIRMLIPPFFLLASVLWGAYLSGDLALFLHSTKDDVGTIKSVLSIVAVAGVATLPLGYAIGVLTLTILGFFSRLFPQRVFDVPIPDSGMKAIWGRLGLPEQPKKRARYGARYGAAAFDHYFVEKPIHEWLFRRWSSFLIASQCVMALFLSIPFAHALHIHRTRNWWITVVGLTCVFIWHAILAWRETYKMFDLATSVDALCRDEKTTTGSHSGSHGHSSRAEAARSGE